MPSPVKYDSFWYSLPDGLGEIEFPPTVLEHFDFYRQTHPKDKEAGGQLFWQYAPEGHRRVASVTGPRPTDQRSRARYKADHRQEQIEINCHYERGLYFLGDWHTHPELIATPLDLTLKQSRRYTKPHKTQAQAYYWLSWVMAHFLWGSVSSGATKKSNRCHVYQSARVPFCPTF